MRLCVSSGQVFRWRETETDRWIGVDGDAVFDASVQGKTLCVQSNKDEAAFRSLFRLDEDLGGYIDRIKAAGPELDKYIAELPGLRVMKPSCVVEEAFCFLCTPNNNLPRILKMVSALAEYGEQIAGTQETRFPTIDVIANIDESDLRTKGFGYRGRTIPEIAKQIVGRGGQRYLLQLRVASYRQAHDELVSIKGIGPKLADCICLFALHHTEAVPVDTHLWQAAVRLYFPEWSGKSLTDQRYQLVGDHFRDRFGELAGWAHQYLFYDNLKNWRTYRKG